MLLLATGCPGPSAPANGTATDAPPATGAGPPPDAVARACARCHLLPPPDALPKSRWAEVIPAMRDVPLPQGVAPLTDVELQASLAWYQAAAPDALPAMPQAAALEPGWTATSFTPQGIEKKIPAVSHVRFDALGAPPKLDLVVAEMRSRTLHVLPPPGATAERRLRLLARDLPYPAGFDVKDLDGDGDLDLAVGGLGGMNPTNAPQGQVALLLRGTDHRFTPQVVSKGLGRVAAVHAGDLDGDGDLDLVVPAFGWRGPGSLLVLEQRAGAPGAPPAWAPHELDPRDGFIHARPVDADGDGDLDLVAALSQEHEQVVLFVNQGRLTFEAKTLWTAPHPAWGTSGLSLHDLDGDGDQDVLLTNGDALDDHLLKPYHGVAWLERRPDHTWAHHRIGDLHGCEAAAAGDLDGDGDQDVVATSFLPQLALAATAGVDSVVWFERTPSGWTRRALERGRCLHPTVAIGDADGDGRPEVAVGNFVWMVEDGKPLCEADWVTLLAPPGR